MGSAKTVRIVYPANARCGYCQIPAADFDPTVHTLWTDPVATIDAAEPGAPVSDAEMRAAIKAATGKVPGPRTSHETLIEQYTAIAKGDA